MTLKKCVEGRSVVCVGSILQNGARVVIHREWEDEGRVISILGSRVTEARVTRSRGRVSDQSSRGLANNGGMAWPLFHRGLGPTISGLSVILVRTCTTRLIRLVKGFA